MLEKIAGNSINLMLSEKKVKRNYKLFYFIKQPLSDGNDIEVCNRFMCHGEVVKWFLNAREKFFLPKRH